MTILLLELLHGSSDERSIMRVSFFFFSSRRRHTRSLCDWSSDVCSSDLKTESKRDSDELPFDLETAIRVCRQAGYFEHAGYLAQKYERHEDYLRIQIEDAGNFGDALAYLRQLGPEAVCSFTISFFSLLTGYPLVNSRQRPISQSMVEPCSNLCPSRPLSS